MALTFISSESVPSYIALSTDISGGTIAGLANIGKLVFLTDTRTWKIIKPDLTLGDYGEIPTVVSYGVAGAAVVSGDITSATAVTDAPTTGQKIVLTGMVLSADTTMNILFEEETSGTDIFKIYILANTPLVITPSSKIKLATANKKLTAKASVAGNVSITAQYYSEP